MAKKRSSIRTPVIAGVALTIVILTPLLLLFAGIEVPVVGEIYSDLLGGILPQTDAEAFEIPIITPEQEMMIDDLIDENNGLIEDEFASVVPCSDGNFTSTDPAIVQECNMLIDEFTDQFDENENMIDELIPDPINQTEFSEDDPFTQIGDETENPALPQSPSLQILLNVVKIDSDGSSTESTTNFDLPPLAFFVQEETDRDFRNGFLDFDPFLKGDPNTRYTGTGSADVIVGGQSIFESSVEIKVDGTTDSEGLLKIDFITPTGGIAKIINLDFEKNFNKFTNEAVTPVIFKIVELEVTDPASMVFSVIDQDIFTMNIARDDFKIVVTDEAGGTQRVYNTDSRLIIQGIPTKVEVTTCYLFYTSIHRGSAGTSVVQYQSDPTHPLGCISEIAPKIVTHSTQDTNVFGITLFDSNGQFIKTIAGGTGKVVDELLSRNTNYTVSIASPELTEELSYPKAQQTKSFTCTNEYNISYTSQQTSGSKSYRTYSTQWDHTFLVVEQVDVKNVNCNIMEASDG